jgi:hypothetical protein
MATTAKPAPSWRDILPVHPAAELFPLMGDDEVAALGADIRKNGLREPVTVVRQYRRGGDGKFDLVLLDGRNRLDAMERAGFTLVCAGKLDKTFGHKALGLEPFNGTYAILSDDVDPYDFVISANIHRRHLTADDKRKVIADLLKAQPEKSNRQIAEAVKADDKTVGSVRHALEGRAEIPHVETRTDTKGRRQPARKRPARKQQPTEADLEARDAAEAANRGIADATEPDPTSSPQAARDNISPDGSGELARLRARVEELEAEKCRLENKITRLESEIEELRRPASEAEAVDAGAAMLGRMLKEWDRASEAVRQRFMERAELVRHPLAIPPSMDRRPRKVAL